MLAELPEYWDLYDNQRRLTGEIHQRGLTMPSQRYHLVTHVLIFNPDNQLLIQQRQTDKASWPSFWDFSAAGSALAGETSQIAGMRETFEELDLKIDLSNSLPRLSLTFSEGFDDYYFVRINELDPIITIQVEEVQNYCWVSETELMDLVRNEQFIPYFFLKDVFKLLDSTGFSLK